MKFVEYLTLVRANVRSGGVKQKVLWRKLEYLTFVSRLHK